MDAAQCIALLDTLRSTDNAARADAEKAYTQALQAEPGRVLTSLVGCLNHAVCADEVLRTQAATMLRRAVVQAGHQESPWSKVGTGLQAQIKIALFQALESEPSGHTRRLLAAAICSVAAQSTAENPWAELLPNVFALAGSADVKHQQAALGILAELMGTDYTRGIMAKRQELGALVGAGLSAPPLQHAALELVCEIILVLDASDYGAMQPVLPMAETALAALAASDSSAFEEALKSLISCAEEQAAFFKPRFREWIQMMLTFAGARGSIDAGQRRLAFEWVSTVAESKAKALVKVVPEFPRKVLETAFGFLAEVEEDDQWPNVDDDVEGDDDDEGACKFGEAKVDFFVKKLGFDLAKDPLLALLRQFCESNRWEGKLGSAMAIRAAVEYVDDSPALDVMATLLIHLTNDEHMRVRYAALHALGQMCHDQEEEFHRRWHERLIPQLVRACQDSVCRVQAMAAGALEACITDLEDDVLEIYAEPILQTFVARLTSSAHKAVLISTMEALGALAAGLEGSFEKYYDQCMALLLAFVARAGADTATAKIRGKAFECISLLGFAVGKERFGPEARQTMSAMLATPMVAEDVQGDSIREAMERMCKIMGADFAPFLPALLPGILASVRIEDAVSLGAGEDDPEGEDEITIPTDDGMVRVKTGQIEEIRAVVHLLGVFVKEIGPSFFEYARPTAQVLAKILGSSELYQNIAFSVRDEVYPCWAELVEVAAKSIQARGAEAQVLVGELTQQFVDRVGADLTKAQDPDDIGPMANGLASVVRNAGAGCLEPAQVRGISDLALSEILKSFQRETALTAGPGPNPLQKSAEGDEDDESTAGERDPEDEEKVCREGLSAVLGACMKASPEVFVSHSWPALQPLLVQWLGSAGGSARILGLAVAGDLCEHLGERAVAVWPVFMEVVFDAVCSTDPGERNAAAFVLLLAARETSFGPSLGARAYVALGSSLQRFKAKKNDEEAQHAADNVVAALCQLCLSHPDASPDLDGCWHAVFGKLPLKVDLDEGRKLHRKLFTEVQKPNGGNLRTMARVAHVLGYLCEQYGHIELCDGELQRDLALALASLPPDTLSSLTSQLPAKQQKKVDRALRDGQALGTGAAVAAHP